MWVSNCQWKESCLHIFLQGTFWYFLQTFNKDIHYRPKHNPWESSLTGDYFLWDLQYNLSKCDFFFILILNGRLWCTKENFLLEFVISKQLSTNQTHNVVNIYLKPNYNRNIKKPNICPTWFGKIFIKFMSMLMKNTECFWFLGMHVSILDQKHLERVFVCLCWHESMLANFCATNRL